MEVCLNKELDLRVGFASKVLGFNKVELVERAILYYLDTVNKEVKLKREFSGFDKLSDEAFLNFEKNL